MRPAAPAFYWFPKKPDLHGVSLPPLRLPHVQRRAAPEHGSPWTIDSPLLSVHFVHFVPLLATSPTKSHTRPVYPTSVKARKQHAIKLIKEHPIKRVLLFTLVIFKPLFPFVELSQTRYLGWTQ